MLSCRGDCRQQTGVLSRPSRHRGEGATEGTSLMHQDPEAIMRQKQAEKRRLQKLVHSAVPAWPALQAAAVAFSAMQWHM